jgi:hypothetical protein
MTTALLGYWPRPSARLPTRIGKRVLESLIPLYGWFKLGDGSDSDRRGNRPGSLFRIDAIDEEHALRGKRE